MGKPKSSQTTPPQTTLSPYEKVLQYANFIHSIVNHYANEILTQDEIESIAWESALSACQSYDETKGTSLKSWIFTKTNGAIIDALRKEQWRREHEIQNNFVFFESCTSSDSAEVPYNISKNQILTAIKNLDERTGEIITRRFFRGQTQSEIATELGISQSWCSRLMNSGIKKLKTELNKYNFQ